MSRLGLAEWLVVGYIVWDSIIRRTGKGWMVSNILDYSRERIEGTKRTECPGWNLSAYTVF